MPLYENECLQCGTVTTLHRTIAKRDLPYTCECGGETERKWSVPYVTPESLYVEGTVTQKGKRAILNDVDDPWSGTPLEGQSEEYMAKKDEFLGKKPANWGDRKGTIVFDTGAAA